MARLKKTDTCAMCGNEATTEDHIPPQSLYPKPRRPNLYLHKVPACKSCNNGASSDDEEFKMIVGISTGESQPDPNAVLASLKRTMAANNRLDEVIRAGRRTVAFGNGQIIQGPVAVAFRSPSYARVVERMIRGLYWRQTGQPLGLASSVKVYDSKSLAPTVERQLRDLLPLLSPNMLNDDTFCFKVAFSSDGSSLWALQLFQKHTVFGLASPPIGRAANER